jgi:phospholipid/cholesterol/gamma-HCH transport system permease protein
LSRSGHQEGEMNRLANPTNAISDAVKGSGWSLLLDGQQAVLSLSGDWIARNHRFEPDAAQRILASGARSLLFHSDALGRWDSALILFLSDLRDHAGQQIAIDQAGLPVAARNLVAMIVTPPAAIATTRAGLLERTGLWIFAEVTACGAIVTLLGTLCLQCAAIPLRRSGLRRDDLLDAMLNAGMAALPIVTLVNFLIGAILAFVGAIQLRRFGADIYVASLVGIAVAREMTAMMTGIIMAGRSGGAYAATLASMRANEEIDALQVVGISVTDYLILPRVLALSAMMPVLYLYGCVVAIFAGWLVAAAILHISAISFLTELRASVALSQFSFGLSKSVAFGALIAMAGCYVGLSAGRSAAEVGTMTTRAVVAGVVGIIVLDAIFALCANALDF